MSVSFEVNAQQNEVTICVAGQLNFNLIHEFREIYQSVNNPNKVVVDLSETEYIDSSGLGILIYLRKHFHCQRDNIQLINCSEQVAKTLSIASFSKLFTIINA